MTSIIEFKNHNGEILRGLINKADSQKGVIFIHGFERTTIEYKFKNVVDKLIGKINMLRFDFSGCGLSDGRFDDITADKLSKEIEIALRVFKKECPNIKNIVIIAHSFGCCAALKFMAGNKGIVSKVIFFAPAFNQKELQRFWFTVSKNKEKEITWDNFHDYFSGEEFEKEMSKEKKLTKAHCISNEYFLENKEMDYQSLLKDLEVDERKIFIVHGDMDESVPFESNNKLPGDVKIIKVQNGDHDLQRVDMVEQYINQVTDFIIKE